jgi:hypothetical protein
MKSEFAKGVSSSRTPFVTGAMLTPSFGTGPNPTLVQRIAVWMFGLVFIGSGLLFLPLAAATRDVEQSWIGAWVTTLIAVLFILGGIRVFRNGFRKRVEAEQQP